MQWYRCVAATTIQNAPDAISAWSHEIGRPLAKRHRSAERQNRKAGDQLPGSEVCDNVVLQLLPNPTRKTMTTLPLIAMATL
jgi:molybdopterin-biosynthesis enzyme MoeA-like protein